MGAARTGWCSGEVRVPPFLLCGAILLAGLHIRPNYLESVYSKFLRTRAQRVGIRAHCLLSQGLPKHIQGLQFLAAAPIAVLQTYESGGRLGERSW